MTQLSPLQCQHECALGNLAKLAKAYGNTPRAAEVWQLTLALKAMRDERVNIILARRKAAKMNRRLQREGSPQRIPMPDLPPA